MKIPEYPTIDEIMEMAEVLDDDIQARVDAAIESAAETQQVRNTAHALFLVAFNGSMQDIYQAMRVAFAPPSRGR
jgi:hypothetical protein